MHGQPINERKVRGVGIDWRAARRPLSSALRGSTRSADLRPPAGDGDKGALRPGLSDRHKVLQILVNLITNAKHALAQRTEGRRLTLCIAVGENNQVRVEVTDNGMGIPQENLTRIFQVGFITKKTGQGFGLHSGANAAKEMGGSLMAYSQGLGEGATFVLTLPGGSRARCQPGSFAGLHGGAERRSHRDPLARPAALRGADEGVSRVRSSPASSPSCYLTP